MPLTIGEFADILLKEFLSAAPSDTVSPSCSRESDMEEVNVKYEACPFCGGEASFDVSKVCFGHGDYATACTVRCRSCHAIGPSFDTWEYPLEACKFHAVEAWNNRTVTQDE